MTEYMAKVKRYDGGESVIGFRVPLSVAREMVSDWNTQYQTDAAYYEEFDREKLTGWTNIGFGCKIGVRGV